MQLLSTRGLFSPNLPNSVCETSLIVYLLYKIQNKDKIVYAYDEDEKDKIIKKEYKVKKINFGIRSASVDRKPLVGKHPTIDNLYIINDSSSIFNLVPAVG